MVEKERARHYGGGMAVHELGEAQRGREAERGRWQQAHMPIIIT